MDRVALAKDHGHQYQGSSRVIDEGDGTIIQRAGISTPTGGNSFNHEHLWAIVLAGGEGERLRPLTEKWLGCHCPKQYCTFVGDRSMLEHTVERTSRVVSPERVMTVVSCEHMRWLETSTVTDLPGRLVKQPANLDTGPGIFLPATYILAEDPDATILIFPSDHFVFPRDRFVSHITRLAAYAIYHSDQLVLLGVEPVRPESDYGWIEPDRTCRSSLAEGSVNSARQVLSFHEKPTPAEAMRFFKMGYLWNTLIMAVSVQTLWQLGQKYLPEMMGLFGQLGRALREGGKEASASALSAVYGDLKPRNFSRDLLQRAVSRIAVKTMDDVEWDDWGRPERIVESLARIGRRPAFTIDLGMFQSQIMQEPPIRAKAGDEAC